MAKKRVVKKSRAKKKPAKKSSFVKKKKPVRKAVRPKKRESARRAAVDSVTSGSEASTLDPKGRLIAETEEEALPGIHKGDLSGDLQGLSTLEYDDSESVSQLVEEGQDLEAELIEGVENAPDADRGNVRVHKAPQKLVPDYKDRNRI